MAAPKPAVIVLLLVVVALVAFFVVGVGLGAGDKPAPSREEKLAWRDKLFGKPEPVLPVQMKLEAPCSGSPALSRIPAGQKCTVQVGSAQAWMRKLTAQSSDGVQLVYKSNGRFSTPIQVALNQGEKPRDEVELSVQKAGGVLELNCQGPKSPVGCLVTLK